MRTPLQAEGLSRRVYPFIGLAIVGLVSLHGSSAVASSPVLLAALAVGVLLALAPLAPIKLSSVRRPILSVPVLVGLRHPGLGGARRARGRPRPFALGTNPALPPRDLADRRPGGGVRAGGPV